jgi:multidrug efflux pump subunit AcrA (membrane-fusion protein)
LARALAAPIHFHNVPTAMKTPHFVLIMTATLALAACSPATAPTEPIRSVKLMTVGISTLGAQAEYAGEVRARTESRLGFRVGGKLVQRPAQVGQRVSAGALLAQLDAQDLALSSPAAQAQVSAAQTQRDLAAADLKRYQDLLAQGFVSGAEIERRQATLQSAEATLQAGQAAQVRLWSGAPGGAAAPLSAVVREVAASADPLTRTYQVKLSLTEGATAPLGATAYVKLAPPTGAPTAAIKLPTSALMRSEAGDRSGSAVWVFDAASSTVQPRPVVVAGADGNEMLIASGLKPGEEVVAAGVHVLSPGQKVTRFAGAATK